MNGNDVAGDCVLAAAAHETELWNAMANKTVAVTAQNSLSDYSALTGYDPNDSTTDQGTNMLDALKYRVNTGIIDAVGVRHKIGAFVALEIGNLQHLYDALWLFGAVEIGIQFPESAMTQFRQGKTWSVVQGSQIIGGHDIPLVAKRRRLECVTWGALQSMTTQFYLDYCDEAYCLLSEEMLTGVKSIEGFDLQTLITDLKLVQK